MKKPLGPWADMRGSALTQGRVCALGKYEDSSHEPTVEHLGCRVNKRVRAISSSGRIVRQMDQPPGVSTTGSINRWEYQPQTAPPAALPTSLRYLARTPRGYLGAGGVKPTARPAIASGVTSMSSVPAATSRLIRSPSWTNAMGPPSTASGESTVGQQQHILAETRALDGTGDRQHLAHARPALGSFIADDHDVAGYHRAIRDGVHRRSLAVEDSGAAFEYVCVKAGRLDDRALGGQRTAQDRQASGPVDRLGYGAQHVTIRVRRGHVGEVLSDRSARYRQAVTV